MGRRRFAALLTLLLSCRTSSSSSSRADADVDPVAAASTVAASPPEPVRTVEVAVPGDLPAFVVRGAQEHRMPMLFLGGACTHPAGYAMAFQHTAAERGDLLALQGDQACGGSFRRWSYDLEATDRRIDVAFGAAGLGVACGVTVVGYSQGAERAEQLVARWPNKYAAAILIASPVLPSPQRLAKADAVVIMAGEFDAQVKATSALGPLRRAGVPTTFVSLPGARHGQMGEGPEETMRQALDFVEASPRRSRINAGRPCAR